MKTTEEKGRVVRLEQARRDNLLVRINLDCSRIHDGNCGAVPTLCARAQSLPWDIDVEFSPIGRQAISLGVQD